MMYAERLKLLGMKTAMGIGVGAVLATLLNLAIDHSIDMATVAVLTMVFGPVACIILCAKQDCLPHLYNSALGMFKSILIMCIESCVGGPVGIAIGCIGLILFAIIGGAVFLAMAVSYPLTLLFLIVMTILERQDLLPGEGKCYGLETLITVVSVVVAIILVWKMCGAMFGF